MLAKARKALRLPPRKDPDAAPVAPGPPPPERVYVQRASGILVECGVILDSVRHGMANWLAVPMGDIDPLDGDRLRVGKLPPQTSVVLQWSRPGATSVDVVSHGQEDEPGVKPVRAAVAAAIFTVLIFTPWYRVPQPLVVVLLSMTWNFIGYVLLISSGAAGPIYAGLRRLRKTVPRRKRASQS
jgi:hypothetical protein